MKEEPNKEIIKRIAAVVIAKCLEEKGIPIIYSAPVIIEQLFDKKNKK